jgi:hypothetical protein
MCFGAALWGSAAAQQGAASRDAPQRLAAVSGVVQDPVTGAGIREAIVVLMSRAAGRTFVQSQSTSPSGRFVFMDVPPADEIILSARKAGYVDGAYGQGHLEQPGQPLSLLAGEWRRDVVLPLWAMGAVEGLVTGPEGAPLIGATVAAYRLMPAYGMRRYVAGPFTRTDDRGRYRLSGLWPGDYIVGVTSVEMTAPVDLIAQAPFVNPRDGARPPNLPFRGTRALLTGTAIPPGHVAGRPVVYPTTYHPGTYSLAEAPTITVDSGGNRGGVNFQLAPVPVVKLTGIVQAPPHALRNMTIRVIAVSDAATGSGLPVAMTRPAADGSFAFHGLPRGAYVLEARPALSELRLLGSDPLESPDWRMPTHGFESWIAALPGGRPPLVVSTRVLAVDEEVFWAAQPLTIGDDDLAGLVLTARRAARVSGRLVIERGQNSADIPRSVAATTGTVISVQPADGRVEALGVPTTATERTTGEFAFAGVLPGKYVVYPHEGVLKSVVSGGALVTGASIDVDAVDLDDLVVTVTDQVSTLVGDVRTPHEEAAADGAVIAFPVEREAWTNYGLTSSRIKAVRISTAGRYRLEQLPAGDYYVVAVPMVHISRWLDPSLLARLSSVAVRVTLAWGETATSHLVRQELK